jgi:hypothetical protein
MRHFRLLIGGILAAGLGTTALGECVLPAPPPVVPDGSQATQAEMRAGHDALQSFVNKLQAYQVCMEDQFNSATNDTRPEVKIAYRTLGNAAIDEAVALAADYDQQLKLFKSLHPGK